jgi:predicted regulator of Ras-like GTPase activity (Roadblock/LC7/MglB family)
MAELPSTPAPPIPVLLSDFVAGTPSVEHVVAFTRDNLVHAYSSGLSRQTAEQWSAILGSLLSMAHRWAQASKRGACEHILHRDRTGHVLTMSATPGCGMGLLLAPGANVKDAASATGGLLRVLGPLLPQEVPTKVGAARHLRGVNSA